MESNSGNNTNHFPTTSFDVRLEISERRIRAMRRPRTSPSVRMKDEEINKTKFLLIGSGRVKSAQDEPNDTHNTQLGDVELDRGSKVSKGESNGQKKTCFSSLTRPKYSKVAHRHLEDRKYPFRPLTAITRPILNRTSAHLSERSDAELSIDPGTSTASGVEFNDIINQSLSTIDLPVAAMEITAPRRYPEKNNFFYEMWVASHQMGVGGEHFEYLNVELVSKLQEALSKAHTEFEVEPQPGGNNAELNEQLKTPSCDSKHVKYLKFLASMSIGVLDLVIQEIGMTYPILVELRELFVLAMFHSPSTAGMMEESLKMIGADVEHNKKSKDLSISVEKYTPYVSFAEKWFESTLQQSETQQLYDSLMKAFQSISENASDYQQKFHVTQNLLEKSQRIRDKYMDEVANLKRDLEDRNADLVQIKSQYLQLKSDHEILETSCQAQSLEQEHLLVTATSNELKMKELEAKAIDYFNTMDKLKKEISDLKRERRELKQEINDLQDTTKRQSVMLSTERVRAKEMTATVHDMLFRSFQSFVDVVTPDDKKERERRDPTDSLVKMYDQSRTIIERVSKERIKLEENSASCFAKNAQLGKEIEKLKADHQDHLHKLLFDHRLEIQNLAKSNAAIQENLRKAGLKKEVEKTALQSMLHAVREEASSLKVQIQKLTEDYEYKIQEMNEKISLLNDRLCMTVQDDRTDQLIRRLKKVLEAKQNAIVVLETQLSESRQYCCELEVRLRAKEKDISDMITATDRTIHEMKVHNMEQLSICHQRIFALEESLLMINEDLMINRTRRMATEKQLSSQSLESQRLKYSFESKLAAISNELAATIKNTSDCYCQTDFAGELSQEIESKSLFKNTIQTTSVIPDMDGDNRSFSDEATKYKIPDESQDLSHKDGSETINVEVRSTIKSHSRPSTTGRSGSDSDYSSAVSGSDDEDSSVNSSFERRVTERAQKLNKDARRNATFFDHQYIPVEANHFHNPQAWQYLSERLAEERQKFRDLVGFLNQEKKKINTELSKFGKMIEDMKVQLPQQIRFHVNQISRINLTQIISSEINRRVSTIQQIPSTSMNSGASIAIVEPLSPTRPQLSQLTELEAKELIKVGKTLNKMLGFKEDKQAKSNTISLEISDRRGRLVSPHEEDEDEDDASSKRKALLNIEYAFPDKMKKKEALRNMIKSKYLNKGTQTTGVQTLKTLSPAAHDISDKRDVTESTMNALFPHRLRADVQTGSEKFVSPHQLSQPFLGFIRKNEKVFSRECSLLKVALRECKSFFDKLMTHVSDRIDAIFTPNINVLNDKRFEPKKDPSARKIKFRTMNDIVSELKQIYSTLQSHQWLFDSKLFVRKLCDHPMEDPIDVASQSQILSSYQELLLAERLHYQELENNGQDASSSAAVIRALEDLITDLTVRLHANGGWRSLFFRSDGTFDTELDSSGFPLDEQVQINAEKVRYLQRKLILATEDHSRSVVNYQNEIIALQDYIQDLRSRVEGDGSRGMDMVKDETLMVDIACNTESSYILIDADEWEGMVLVLRTLSAAIIDDFHLATVGLVDIDNQATQHGFEQKSAEILSVLAKDDGLDIIQCSKKLKELKEGIGSMSVNKNKILMFNNHSLDKEYVPFVKPICVTQEMSPSMHKLRSTDVAKSKVVGAARPWTSSGWRRLEQVVKDHDSTFKVESHSKHPPLEVVGASKVLTDHHPGVSSTKVECLLRNSDNSVKYWRPVLDELVMLAGEIKDILMLTNRQKLQQSEMFGQLTSKSDYDNIVTKRDVRSVTDDNFIHPCKKMFFDDEEFSAPARYANGSWDVGEEMLDNNESTVLVGLNEKDSHFRSFRSEYVRKTDLGLVNRSSDGLGEKLHRHGVYEKLISSVYHFTKEREHSDLMKYAMVMYDRYQQHHNEAKKMKNVLVSLQNSHHVFEDAGFLRYLEKQSLHHGRKSIRHSCNTGSHENANLTVSDINVAPKKYKEYWDKKHKGFSRSHVAIMSTELSSNTDFDIQRKPMRNFDVSKELGKTFNIPPKEDMTKQKIDDEDYISNYTDIVNRSLDLCDSIDGSTQPTIASNISRKREKVQRSIEVARLHYGNPLSSSPGQQQSVHIATAVQTMSFDRAAEVKILQTGPTQDEINLFNERQVKNQATLWTKSLSDVV